MNLRLCVVALPKADILPRITIHEYRLASRRSTRTQIAMGPMLLIIWASPLNPCDGVAGVPAPPSA
jgi:hypothetical protein